MKLKFIYILILGFYCTSCNFIRIFYKKEYITGITNASVFLYYSTMGQNPYRHKVAVEELENKGIKKIALNEDDVNLIKDAFSNVGGKTFIGKPGQIGYYLELIAAGKVIKGRVSRNGFLDLSNNSYTRYDFNDNKHWADFVHRLELRVLPLVKSLPKE